MVNHKVTIVPSHEIMVLFVLRKLILQTHMNSHPVSLDVWSLVGPFVYFNTSSVQTAKALVRLRKCAVSPEPLLVAYAISPIISWVGSINYVNYEAKYDELIYNLGQMWITAVLRYMARLTNTMWININIIFQKQNSCNSQSLIIRGWYTLSLHLAPE